MLTACVSASLELDNIGQEPEPTPEPAPLPDLMVEPDATVDMRWTHALTCAWSIPT
jgi:hypothetical protein